MVCMKYTKVTPVIGYEALTTNASFAEAVYSCKISPLPALLIRQEFQVYTIFGYFGGGETPLQKPYPYSLYDGEDSSILGTWNVWWSMVSNIPIRKPLARKGCNNPTRWGPLPATKGPKLPIYQAMYRGYFTPVTNWAWGPTFEQWNQNPLKSHEWFGCLRAPTKCRAH